MFDALKRPYKITAPEETISVLRSVLEKNQIMPHVSFNANPYPGVYSMTVQLNDTIGGFQTHGKGSTYVYAHASALAEFIERIQNGFFAQYSRVIQQEIGKKAGCYFYPDEKEITIDEFMELPEKILDDIIPHSGEGRNAYIDAYFERLHQNGQKGVLAVPYYDVFNEKIQYIPYNLLVLAIGSNGNAAGNSIVEAVFQGICEITERWAGAEIFHSLLTPPTVPREIISQYDNEYAAITEIEKDGEFFVEVKDFSAGKDIPAVGVIIYNKTKDKYRLNIGSDTSFQVALSRSLSEIYQGIVDAEQFKLSMLDVPKCIEEMFTQNTIDAQLQREEKYALFCRDNSGSFPASLFGAIPSYPISKKAFSTYETYEQEVVHLLQRMKELGHSVYIRDVSFLGFPSVSVYIPTLTVKGKKSTPLHENKVDFNITEHDRILSDYFRFKDLSDAEIKDIADVLSRFDPELAVEEVFETKLRVDSPFKGMSISFLATLLWYYLGNIESAYKYFNIYWLKDENKTDYNNAVHDYLRLKNTSEEESKIYDVIIKKYGKNIGEEVLRDMATPRDVFKYMLFPRCPDCNVCDLSHDCITGKCVNISIELLREYKRHPIDQLSLAKLFETACIHL